MTDLDPNVLEALASLDGAIVTDRHGRLLAAGAILRHPPMEESEQGGEVEGARTTAALAANQLRRTRNEEQFFVFRSEFYVRARTKDRLE